LSPFSEAVTNLSFAPFPDSAAVSPFSKLVWENRCVRMHGVSIILVALWLGQTVSRAAEQAPQTPSSKPPSTSRVLDLSKDPIAYIGHGSIFDRNGKELEITPEFASEVESFYCDAVLRIADEKTRAAYEQKRKPLLDGKNWDKRTEFFIKSALLEKLLKDTQPVNAGDISGKDRLLKQELLEGFELPISARQLLAREELK
jgi:hypothetical protein